MPSSSSFQFAHRISPLQLIARWFRALAEVSLETPRLVQVASAGNRVSRGPVLKAAIMLVALLGNLGQLGAVTTLSPASESSTSAEVGISYTGTFAATGAPKSASSYAVSGLPPGLSVAGATFAAGTNTYSLNAPFGTIAGTPTTAGVYSLTITAWDLANGAGSSWAYGYNITVIPVLNTAPTIATQPADQIVAAGHSATFTVAAIANPLPTYQWQRLPAGSGTWTNLGEGGGYAGTASATLTIANTTAAMGGDQFRCVTTNNAGTATSNVGMLTIDIAADYPVTSQTVTSGHDVTFSAGDTGGAIQWQISTDSGSTWENLANDNTYSGVTTATLTIRGAGASLNNAQIRYFAIGSGLLAISNAATLTVVQAFFPYPTSIARDSAGNLYVSDSNTDTVKKITPAGQVSPVAGTNGSAGSADGTGAAARFNQPAGLALTPSGILYVADTANATIRRIGTDAIVTTLAGSPSNRGNGDGTGAAALFAQPIGVALDSSGTMVVADSLNHTIRKVTAAGVVTTWAGTAGVTGTADGNGAAARFNLPTGIAVDASGNVYVADTTNNTIRAITPAGAVTTLAGLAGVSGSDDGAGAAALFNHPGTLAVDTAGNLYLADTGNSVIRKITPTGTVTTLAGLPGVAGHEDGPSSNALFNQPLSLAVDSAGNIYVADSGNAAIRKITAAGAVTTLTLSAAPDPVPPPTPNPTPTPPTGATSSGGGGGAINSWFAGLLGLLLLSRRNRLRN